jgi:hypothetical protein
LQPGRNVKVGMCVCIGFYRIGSRLIHSGRRHWECRQPRSNRFTTVDMATNFVPTQTLQYCSIVKCSAYWPCRLEHRSTEFWSWRTEPVWARRNYVVEWSAARSRPHNHITAKEKWACHSGKRK